MQSAAQLANLTPFQPGHKTPRASRSVLNAIGKCRRFSPEMIEMLVGFARDPLEPTAIRVRCAEIILDKAIPGARERNNPENQQGDTFQAFTVVFVNPGETIAAKPNGNGTFAVSFDAE